MLEARVRRKERRSVGVSRQFAVHLLGHVDEPVDRTQEIAVERPVDKMVFVRLDIVDLTQHPGVAVAAGQPGDRPETGRHEGRPVFQQHEIGPLAPQPPPDTQPIERIHCIHAALDAQIGGRRRVDRLALSGKEPRGILQAEGVDLHLVAPVPEDMGHRLHDRRQTAPVGMRRAKNRDFLHKPSFSLLQRYE